MSCVSFDALVDAQRPCVSLQWIRWQMEDWQRRKGSGARSPAEFTLDRHNLLVSTPGAQQRPVLALRRFRVRSTKQWEDCGSRSKINMYLNVHVFHINWK